MLPEGRYELYFEMSTGVVRARYKVFVMFVLTTCRAVRTFTFCSTVEDMTSGKGMVNPLNVKS